MSVKVFDEKENWGGSETPLIHCVSMSVTPGFDGDEEVPPPKFQFLHQHTVPQLKEPKSSDSIEELKSHLGKSARVKMEDGRVVIGTFAGVDDGANTLLRYATEYREVRTPAGKVRWDGRGVGTVNIPGSVVLSMEVAASK